jgi:hypothetical protein
MELEATTWNVEHGGHDKPSAQRPAGSQHRWEAALDLASQVLSSVNPYRVILVQEAFLWQRLGRLRAFAEATGTTPYVAPGRHQLDLVAFVGPGLRVGDWKANPGHLKAPALILPVRLDGWSDDILIATTHLDPFSADTRVAQILALSTLLGDRLALLGLDANCIGPDDTEPDLMSMPQRQRGCHTHQVDGALRWDRRPTQAARQAGWVDLARRFGRHDVATGGFGQPFPPVRFDQLWASPDLAGLAVEYEVHDSDEFTAVSDHVPVTVRLDLADRHLAGRDR